MHNKHKKIRNFATHLNREVFICFLCKDKHDLHKFNSFKEKVLQQRSKFLFEQELCYGCLSQIPASHNARNCKKRKEFKVC